MIGQVGFTRGPALGYHLPSLGDRMSTLLTLTTGHPRRQLARGETLVAEEEEGSGELFILEQGRLVVERNGVAIATIAEPGALVGEMSVLLGTAHSATVRAETAATVRVIDNAVAFLERTPLVALHVATLACARLNATSALLAHLRQETAGRAAEQGLLNRIWGALTVPAPSRNGTWKAHE